jgi:hypothetical protein
MNELVRGGPRWFLLLILLGPLAVACSTGAGGGGAAGAHGGAGTAGGASGAAAGTSGGGASAGSGGASGSASDAGTAGTAGAGGSAGQAAGASGQGGAAGQDGSSGASGQSGASGTGGAKSCAGNAISLSANATGSANDDARARILIDLMGDLPIGDANRTIEFWAYIKPTDWVGEKNELYVYGDLNTKAGAFGMDFGTFAVMGMPGNHATLNPITGGGFNDDSTNDLGITSAAPQWVHIAMTWDGTVVRTYVNGGLKITSKGTGGVTMLATVASPLSVGCNPFSCFNGLFDELRVWKTARSDAEIMANYDKVLVGDEAGLVGYWKFDEAPGATASVDSVTSAGHTAHPATLMSAMPAGFPTFVTPSPPAPISCR